MRRKIPLLIDNTFATPYLSKPIELGADIVMHSVTKWIGGHGIAIGGVIVDGGRFDWRGLRQIPDADRALCRLSRHRLRRSIRAGRLHHAGARRGPARFRRLPLADQRLPPAAGRRDAGVRMERHMENTHAVLAFLGQERRRRVGAASFAGEPPRLMRSPKSCCRRAPARSSASASRAAAPPGSKFIEALRLASHLANVGDAKTLVIHPASTTHQQMDAAQLKARRRRRGTGPPLGRHRGRERHHRRSRPGAARLAEGLTMHLTVNGNDTFVATGGRRSMPRCLRLCSARRRASTTRCGRCSAAGSRITALRCWRPTCPATAARPARRSRPSPPWPTGPRRCSMPPAPRRPADRPFHGLADRARGRGAAPGTRRRPRPGRHRGRHDRSAPTCSTAAEPTITAAIDMVSIWGRAFRRPRRLARAGAVDARRRQRVLQHARPGVLFSDLAACNSYQNALAAAAQVALPTTVILGERDMMTPPRPAALAAAVPNSAR